jgi:hypothetical protein
MEQEFREWESAGNIIFILYFTVNLLAEKCHDSLLAEGHMGDKPCLDTKYAQESVTIANASY